MPSLNKLYKNTNIKVGICNIQNYFVKNEVNGLNFSTKNYATKDHSINSTIHNNYFINTKSKKFKTKLVYELNHR